MVVKELKIKFDSSTFGLLVFFLLNFCAISIMWGNAGSLGALDLFNENLTVTFFFITINGLIIGWINAYRNIATYFSKRKARMEEEE